MLSISNLSYNIGDRIIFSNAQIHIKPKEKIGLIGLNGTGKTTLLKILNGEITPDSGEISRKKICTIGFLNQDLLSYQSEESIVAVAMEAFKETVEIEIIIEHLIKQLETDYSDNVLHRLATLQEKYEAMGGYTLQSQAEEILEGVGFKTSDLHRPLSEFSGGWRMRVMLAKLLLEKPSILMLDEPTNHLDLPSIQWVENYLKNYEGSAIIVSHDKIFLDNTISKIIEVNNFKLNSFIGNYSFYLQERVLRNEIQKNAFLNQQQKIKQTEQFINRFRAKSTKARQVQSRVKSLERMDKVEDVKSESAEISFKFSFSQKSGRHVTQLKNVSKSFGKLEVLKPSTIGIERGDKIALIGANGIGKSTLLRIIANTESHGGKVETGYNVVPTFYAQHQIEALTLENEILDELKQVGSGKLEQELRMVLGCFLFSGDDVFKKIKVLSGGEKSRVALAKTLISEANFLLLDEPTNHLDIISVNILIQALQQFKGTFIFVSHDRYFISEIANKIWYIENQQIKEYPGTFREFEIWNNRQKIKNVAHAELDTKEKKQKKKKPAHSDLDAKRSNQLRKLKKRLEYLENEIDILEAESLQAEESMSEPEIYGNIDKLAETNKQYDHIKTRLEEKNLEWGNIAEEIERLE